jgi:hypothetical protein
MENLEEIEWRDTLIRKFNGEVRCRVMKHFDALYSASISRDDIKQNG